MFVDYSDNFYHPITSSNQNKLKILAIGFLPPPLGGISVSFSTFCNLVSKREDIVLRIISVSGMNHRNHLLGDATKLIADIWRAAGQNHVIYLYCNPNQIPTLGLTTWLISRLRRKPMILRMAGGGVHYRKLGPLMGRLAEFVVRHVEQFHLQTKRLVKICQENGVPQSMWCPTSRIMGESAVSRTRCERFVYVGQIRYVKGISELIAAAENLPDDIEVHVYGPLLDGIAATAFDGCKHLTYKGVLAPENVIATMNKYDALILPSKAVSEGYPGVILEALSVGLPIIATTVGGIPEIVNARCGILVEPGNVSELTTAMQQLITAPKIYRELHLGAKDMQNHFSAEYWSDWLVDQCALLYRQRM